MRLMTTARGLAALFALLLTTAAYGAPADAPTNITYNFRTGAITFTYGGCFDSNILQYRYGTTGDWTQAVEQNGNANIQNTGDSVSAIADKDYVQVRMYAQPDSPCNDGNSPYTPVVTYTAVTVASNRSPLTASNIDGAELTVTLGSDHSFGSSVSASSSVWSRPRAPQVCPSPASPAAVPAPAR